MGQGRGRFKEYVERIRVELRNAASSDHSSSQVAASFAVGVFFTSLPTVGGGLLVLAAIAYYIEEASKIALFAAVLVLNPVAKWGVYAGSFWLGSQILGPVGGVSPAELSLTAGPAIVTRLLLGNLIVAVAFTVVGYVLAYYVADAYHRRTGTASDLPRDLELGDD